MSSKEMDLKKVKELVDLMKENDLVELEIVDGTNKISLKRPQPQTVVTQVPMAAAIAAAPIAAAPAPEEDSGLTDITAPMVGTFYASPSPDSDPFISIGSKVAADTVVCIIEAMKVMNEIKAETTGTIVEVICNGGEAVEFGQPMFKVKTN